MTADDDDAFDLDIHDYRTADVADTECLGRYPSLLEPLVHDESLLDCLALDRVLRAMEGHYRLLPRHPYLGPMS